MNPPRSTPPSELQITANAIKRDVELVNVRAEVLEQRMASITDSLQTLIEQIGRLTEIVTFNANQQEQRAAALDAKLGELADINRNQARTLDARLSEIADISRIQANTAASLVQVVNKLLERN